MAMVQAMPIASERQNSDSENQLRPTRVTSPSAMGSVGSLVSGRTYLDKHCRATEYTSRGRKPNQAQKIFRQPDGLLKNGYSQDPGRKLCSGATRNGGFACVCEEHRNGGWQVAAFSPASPESDHEDVRDGRAVNGSIQGPPPKIIPVSGKLEKNMEKQLIRPTAFRAVLPKARAPQQHSAPRPSSDMSDSQGSLNLLFGGGSVEKRSSLQGPGCRSSVHSGGSMSDSGRNSLSSLPTYSTGCSHHHHQGEPVSNSMGHISLEGCSGGPHGFQERGATGLSASDSGRSSSSKSTASLSGRGHPLSDTGSRERSPPPPPLPPPLPPAGGQGHEGLARDLEERLRERESELQQLRESLEENEAALCQIYEEKQRHSEQELEELRQVCASKIKQSSQKAQRTHQVLQLQVFQLQQEKKKLQEDFAQLLQEREILEKKCSSIEREQTELGPRLEETKWEVCQKSGEISLLKQQLKDSQAETGAKGNEIVCLKSQLRELQAELQDHEDQIQEFQDAVRMKTLELEVCENELQRKKNEAELLREKVRRMELEAVGLREALGGTRAGLGSYQQEEEEDEEDFLVYESDEAKAQRKNVDNVQALRQQLERLKAELIYERRKSEDQMDGFEVERQTWQEEKEKVIRYQKQLQHNYIQMYRRNRELEREMRQLTLELEARDLDDFEVQNEEIRFEEITATEI
uniref:Leucine zipper putative tumor suppressor 2 homolog n=1 Tax=Callorhinchus milii TaxID=7868 RepID=A0A4W3JUG0_CALMI|eukprot:gi/632970756/ref/XP_007901824.1/ PREDICTED: leucine zipper putative tumor suppressor 2 [Callorhinchus milii]